MCNRGRREVTFRNRKRGRRQWPGKADEQKAVYANRRRVKGNYGKTAAEENAGELIERSFAHCYENRRHAASLSAGAVKIF